MASGDDKDSTLPSRLPMDFNINDLLGHAMVCHYVLERSNHKPSIKSVIHL